MTELFQSTESLVENESEVKLPMITPQQSDPEDVAADDDISLDVLQELVEFCDVMSDVTLIDSSSTHRFMNDGKDFADQDSFTFSWHEIQRTIMAFNYSLHLPSQMDVNVPCLDELESQITADIHAEMRRDKLTQIFPYLIGYEHT